MGLTIDSSWLRFACKKRVGQAEPITAEVDRPQDAHWIQGASINCVKEIFPINDALGIRTRSENSLIILSLFTRAQCQRQR